MLETPIYLPISYGQLLETPICFRKRVPAWQRSSAKASCHGKSRAKVTQGHRRRAFGGGDNSLRLWQGLQYIRIYVVRFGAFFRKLGMNTRSCHRGVIGEEGATDGAGREEAGPPSKVVPA